jgi:hypothetical protein
MYGQFHNTTYILDVIGAASTSFSFLGLNLSTFYLSKCDPAQMFPSGEGREYIYAPDNQTF